MRKSVQSAALIAAVLVAPAAIAQDSGESEEAPMSPGMMMDEEGMSGMMDEGGMMGMMGMMQMMQQMGEMMESCNVMMQAMMEDGDMPAAQPGSPGTEDEGG